MWQFRDANRYDFVVGYNDVEGKKYFGEMPSHNLRCFVANDRGTRHCYQQQKWLGRGPDSSRHLSWRR